jgi:transposase
MLFCEKPDSTFSQHALEVLEATVDFEYFRGWLVEGLGYGAGARGGRPPFDPVSMFKALILQAQHNLSDARMEFMIRDRLSWMRFLKFDLGGPTPDENTIRLFRNKLTETGTLRRVMKAFDWQLQKKGYIPMSGQIVDASLVPAPEQRNTDAEKHAIKAGKSADEIWPDEPNKAAQKDVDARWTLKVGGKIRFDGRASLCRRSPCRSSATRATLRSTGASALSGNAPRPRRRTPMGGCCRSWWRRTTHPPRSGPTAPRACCEKVESGFSQKSMR